MDKTLQSFFTEVELPGSLAGSELIEVSQIVKTDMLALKIAPVSLLPAADIIAAENALKVLLGCGDVNIYPQYKAALLSPEYVAQILMLLQLRFSAADHFFEDAKITLSDENCDINLAHGGRELLLENKLDNKIEQHIRIYFDRKLSVSFSGVTEIALPDYIKKQEDEIASLPPITLARISAASTPDRPAYGGGGRRGRSAVEPKPFTLPFTSEHFGADATLIVGNTKDFQTAPVSMQGVDLESAETVTLWGEVFAIDEKTVSEGKNVIIKISFSDKTSSQIIKIFTASEKADGFKPIAVGKAILVCGKFELDKFEKSYMINAKSVAVIKTIPRLDHYAGEQKRVELHLHTKMSDMDAVSEASELVRQAFDWGHRAVAVTDHGNVQAFPDAMNTAEKLIKANPGREFKVLYGVEAYFVNDGAELIPARKDYSINGEFIVFDFETTGFSPVNDRITEIGAVRVKNLEICGSFHTYVNAGMNISEEITRITGIDNDTLADAPDEAEAFAMFNKFIGETGADNPVLAAHNASFDMGFLRAGFARFGLSCDFDSLDTLGLCRTAAPSAKSHKLDAMAAHFRAGEFEHHRASEDARILAQIFINLTADVSRSHPIEKLGDFNTALSGVDIKKERYFHMIILVKNKTGLKNLYKLVSFAHLDYYYKKPRIPLSELRKHREGLLLGSACEQGEVFRAVLSGKSDDQIEKIAALYDYLEIQPIGNNAFLVRSGDVASEYALQVINEKIYKLGKRTGKPVVATCDVHFKDPDDSIFREILQAGQGYKDASAQAQLFFRTTDEMLSEFDYLGKEAAEEVVITNPNKIADSIEVVRPIPSGTFTPKMDGAEEGLKAISWGKVHELYGDEPNELIVKRLEKELNAIITYGFSVLYMIAQKLVQESEQNGYHVGSRGSVGSSFVATMLGISEVNPLPPHYRCKKCRYTEFTPPELALSGYDLPAKNCPVCGEDTPLERDGHDIPFETFLGFKGDKAPDIDLNFSGEYQSRSHRYTEEMFGKENVFKAGTISKVQDKTAFGFVNKFLESRGMEVNKAEKNRLVAGCVGVKTTTSQHPGGMVVVPGDMEVYDFTPIQYPANSEEKGQFTTHFDIHALHDTILKLDELGHDVPTLYKRLEEQTGIKIADVSTSDPEGISLFTSPKALRLKKEDPDIIPLGTYGLPEFGTSFVMKMLADAKPRCFADLLQISGLSHGTNVWLGNAAELISGGICTISNVIGTRDDIMVYLIRKGMEPGMAFKIMEITRKGGASKFFTDEIYQAFADCNVEPWYVDSCKKIKYMFPKAHAAAYVTGAVKLGWFKVHMPAQFYAAVLTRHTGAMDISAALHGPDAVKARMQEISANESAKTATPKEYAMREAFLLVYEMQLRGINFLPPHYLKSHATRYIVEDNNLRLPFSSISGCAENTALKLYEAIAQGGYVCVDDLKTRSGLNNTVVQALLAMSVFDGLPETAQISLFDF